MLRQIEPSVYQLLMLDFSNYLNVAATKKKLSDKKHYFTVKSEPALGGKIKDR